MGTARTTLAADLVPWERHEGPEDYRLAGDSPLQRNFAAP